MRFFPQTLASQFTATGNLQSAIDALPSIALEDLPADSALQTRTDRKYVLDERAAVTSLTAVEGLVSVRVGGLANSAYESVYFDTPESRLFRDAATGRRHRFKVRTRTYCESGETYVEVKVKTGRGDTHKERIAATAPEARELSAQSRAFVVAVLERHSVCSPQEIVANLAPTLRTSYQRSTLLASDGSRTTIDTQLRCVQGASSIAWPRLVLVETKAETHATELDKALWRQGSRPVSFSKFAAGMVAFDQSLPHNKWNRVLGQELLQRVTVA